MARYDTAIVNGTVVMPYVGAMRSDVGVREGRIAALADAIAPGDADQIIDARGRLVLPGAVDSHFHIGIYRDLARDAESDLARIVELASANPARAFGLFPKKGAITVGSDADLVVIDAEREQTISPSVLHSAQDFTPFAGMRVKGWPTHTFLRGQLVFDGKDVLGAPSGRYVKRPA
jgi:dihydroorotase-like cyclic amidohydrolase